MPTDAEARLTDDFLKSYLCWRDACLIAEMAYERWRNEQQPDRAQAFAVLGDVGAA